MSCTDFLNWRPVPMAPYERVCWYIRRDVAHRLGMLQSIRCLVAVEVCRCAEYASEGNFKVAADAARTAREQFDFGQDV